jgi:hypothetical protein
MRAESPSQNDLAAKVCDVVICGADFAGLMLEDA